MTAAREGLADQLYLSGAGAVLLVAYLWLFPLARPGLDDAFLGYLMVTGLAGGVTLLLALRALQRPSALPVAALLCWALAFRLVALSAPPLMEDDPFRYLWDGWVTLSLGSPYGVPPAAFFDSPAVPERWESVLDAVAYPQVPTVYGPFAQALFALSVGAFDTAVWPLQGIALTGDLAILVLLLRLVPAGRRPLVALLYGWSPLVIKEFANSAHIDSVGVALLLAAIALASRGRGLPSAVLLGLAVAVKPFALLAAPFLLTSWAPAVPRPVLRWLAALVLAVTVLLIAWPLGAYQALAPEGLGVMASGWVFNAPLHQALLHCCGTSLRRVVGAALALAVGVFVLASWWRRYRRAADQGVEQWPLWEAFGLLLLILPAMNPWYLVWVLPFALLRSWPEERAQGVGPISPWVATIAVALSYGSGINLSGGSLDLYEQPAALLSLEYGAICGAVLLDLWRWRRAAR